MRDFVRLLILLQDEAALLVSVDAANDRSHLAGFPLSHFPKPRHIRLLLQFQLVTEDEEFAHLLVREFVLELVDCYVDVMHLGEHLLLRLLQVVKKLVKLLVVSDHPLSLQQ